MSPLQIANLALGWLGVSPIASFEDTARPARLIKDQFDGIRDVVLEERDWSFGTGRAELPLDPVKPPASSYAGRYALPGTIIRVLRAWAGDQDSSLSAIAMVQTPEEGGLDWQIEAGAENADGSGAVGRYICAATDANPLFVKAILRIEDSSLWSPSFCQAVAARLAADLCVPICQDKALAAQMWTLYEQKLASAAANDGRQGASVRITSNYLRNRRA